VKTNTSIGALFPGKTRLVLDGVQPSSPSVTQNVRWDRTSRFRASEYAISGRESGWEREYAWWLLIIRETEVWCFAENRRRWEVIDEDPVAVSLLAGGCLRPKEAAEARRT
jgi:hypothetical protein